ncbi:M56 family metallopeptidase [Dyadobacter sp. CY326]|uniref:M56 family metallopeptidase n=1 Tax=Dyadobacter sp. CY326 TaxID=2907300 RepID=UPI001F1B7306|nr:M56 family metallopeptidase [Dyadobacter sp. CY326]MCE7068096.1 TonB-dependent receptor plug domain-containing protein [Dyadobacter sp. CY326]
MILATGSLYLLIRFTKSIVDLIALINKGELIDLDNFKLVLLPHSNVGSFSFFKWLVINQVDYAQNFEPILRHESVHIRQMHSIDIVLIELLKIVFWFNPIVWFYKRSIQEVHEFLADEHAPDRDGYARFLVAYAFNTPAASLTNHFFNGPLLKSRIKMIYKNRNSEWLRSKYFIILPLICFVAIMTAAREKVSTFSKAEVPLIISEITANKGEVQNHKAEVLADSEPKREKQMSNSLKREAPPQLNAQLTTSESYTATAQDTAPEPSKKTTFTNYRYAANIGPIAKLDSLPKIGKTLTIKSNKAPGSKALIIVDGVKQEERGSMGYRQIAPDQIESISVLKEQSAIEAYGSEGTEGVIIIKTKK